LRTDSKLLPFSSSDSLLSREFETIIGEICKGERIISGKGIGRVGLDTIDIGDIIRDLLGKGGLDEGLEFIEIGEIARELLGKEACP
jgi:hypothetical protein